MTDTTTAPANDTDNAPYECSIEVMVYLDENGNATVCDDRDDVQYRLDAAELDGNIRSARVIVTMTTPKRRDEFTDLGAIEVPDDEPDPADIPSVEGPVSTVPA